MAKFADEAEPAATVKPGMTMAEQPAQASTPCACCQPAPQAQPAPQPVQPQETRKVGTAKTCTACKADCDHLEFRKAAIVEGTATTDGISRMLDYEEEEEEDDTKIIVFKCPHCGAVLFDDEDDALDFLEN